VGWEVQKLPEIRLYLAEFLLAADGHIAARLPAIPPLARRNMLHSVTMCSLSFTTTVHQNEDASSVDRHDSGQTKPEYCNEFHSTSGRSVRFSHTPT